MGKCVHRAHQAAGSNGRVVGGLDGRHALRARVVAVDGSAATLTGHHLLVRALTDALAVDKAMGGRVGPAPRCLGGRVGAAASFGGGATVHAVGPGVRREVARGVAVAVNVAMAGLDDGGSGATGIDASRERDCRLDLGDERLLWVPTYPGISADGLYRYIAFLRFTSPHWKYWGVSYDTPPT